MRDWLIDNLRLIPGAVVATFLVLGLTKLVGFLVPAIPRWRAQEAYRVASRLTETQYNWWLLGGILRSSVSAVVFGGSTVVLGISIGWRERLEFAALDVAFVATSLVFNLFLFDILIQSRKLHQVAGRFDKYLERLKRVAQVELEVESGASAD